MLRSLLVTALCLGLCAPSAQAQRQAKARQVVIVGGNGAGVAAARQVRRVDPKARITLLESGADVSYGKCPMPYKLDKGQSLDSLVRKSANSLREQDGIDVKTGHRVTSLDRRGRRLRGTHGGGQFDIRYDKLIIATGTHATTPPIKGLDKLEGKGIYRLHSLQDARTLKSALHPKRGARPRRAVVVGAGFVGLETAEQLAKQGLEVTIVQRGELLPGLPGSMRERVAREAAKSGVRLEVATEVSSVERRPSGSIRVATNKGRTDADLVLIATGAAPNSSFAKDAGLELSVNNTIRVDRHMRTSDPHVFAAGDVADSEHAVTRKRTWVPLALNANVGGRVAGSNAAAGRTIRGGAAKRWRNVLRPGRDKAAPVAGTSVFKFYNLEVARAGLSKEDAAAAGYEPVEAVVEVSPGLSVSLVVDRKSRTVLGGAMVGDGRASADRAAHRIDALAVFLHKGAGLGDILAADLGPRGERAPLTRAAAALAKQLGGKSRPSPRLRRRGLSDASRLTTVSRSGDTDTARVGMTSAQARRAGYRPAEVTTTLADGLTVTLIADRKSGMLLGGSMVGKARSPTHGVAHRIDALSALLYAGGKVDDLLRVDLAFAPPFGPSRSPLAQAAIALKKKLGES